jgi:hypothetical protein
MLRVLLYVTLLGALFVGAVLWTGNAVGAFEPMNVPAHAPGMSTKKAKAKTPQHHKHEKHKRA